MADVVALHARAARRFDELVDAVPDDGWEGPTPCTEWTVRDLLAHMTYEGAWAPALLAGATIEEVGDRFDGDLLGVDPKGAFHAANRGEVEAAARPGVPDATVHTSMGPLPATEYLRQRLGDLVVHGWDLAAALGIDPGLDPEAVAYCLETSRPWEEAMKASGLFGERIEVAADADILTRLLAVYGRRADWPAQPGRSRPGGS